MRGVQDSRGYLDSDQSGIISAPVSDAARMLEKLFRETVWVAHWRHLGTLGAVDLSSVESVDMLYF